MRTTHRAWLRDLFARPASGRFGLVDGRAAAGLVASADGPGWFPAVWKLTCIEVWARVFLEADPTGRIPADDPASEVPFAS